ncbi:peptidase S8/S53 domain-containing protein [Lipomyces oligophaga]|uniref:peptidase S8/S53 domain-containing protein n=1 Tax=Lipomyces oligophaga TaxID=45792 RepID=UPI0034CF3E4C
MASNIQTSSVSHQQQQRALSFNQRINEATNEIITQYSEIIRLAPVANKDRATTAAEVYQIECHAVSLIHSIEELLTISRTLKESWILGQAAADTYPLTFFRAGSVRNNYIVVFNASVNTTTIQSHFKWLSLTMKRFPGYDKFHQQVLHKFTGAVLPGYSGHFMTSFVSLIAKRPEVAYIESDLIYTTLDVQMNATYNLARLSHRDTLDRTTENIFYYDSDPGVGTTLYILDTGITVDHVDFSGRATMVNFALLSSNRDRIGHGTHVAGTAAGSQYGVAKSAKIVGVKVLGDTGSGTTSTIIRGLEWVSDQHKRSGGPSIVNMSLGGGRSQAFNDAVRKVVDQGIHVVVAAGNSHQDACGFSPAGEEAALTVGATNVTDHMAPFSNFGPCVDVFAPGVDVHSDWHTDEEATRKASGTSMSSPLVAGLVAYLASKSPSTKPQEMKSMIQRMATENLIPNLPNEHSPNFIAYNGYSANSTVNRTLFR